MVNTIKYLLMINNFLYFIVVDTLIHVSNYMSFKKSLLIDLASDLLSSNLYDMSV